jgi:hypothetical protein
MARDRLDAGAARERATIDTATPRRSSLRILARGVSITTLA